MKRAMVIFDLDGTLWDSGVSVAESWNMEIERVTGRPSNILPDDIRGNAVIQSDPEECIAVGDQMVV